MGLLRTLGVTAALTCVLYAGEPGQMTYKDSLAAKDKDPCIGQMIIREKSAYNLGKGAHDASLELKTIFYDRNLSDEKKRAGLLALRPKYGNCISNISLSIPESFMYEQTGRVKPPLVGSFEQQVNTIVREARATLTYHANYEAGLAKKRQFESRNIRSVSQITRIVGDLPEPITADIDISSQEVRGSIRPKFLGYEDDNAVAFHNVDGPPKGSRLVLRSGNNELYQTQDGYNNGFVLLRKYFTGGAKSYSAFSREDLMNYMKFLDSPNSSRKLSDVPPFTELSKFLNRLGTDFDGAGKFKAGRSRTMHGDIYTDFKYYGFRVHNNIGAKEIGAAIYFSDPGWDVDNYYVSDFRRNFSEFAVGGRRQEIHMFPDITGHSGTHPPRIIELPARIPGKFFIILEEK